MVALDDRIPEHGRKAGINLAEGDENWIKSYP